MFHGHEVFKESVVLAIIHAFEVLASRHDQATQAAPSLEAQHSLDAQLRPAALKKLLSEPPQFQLGQAAFPCFPFAKILKKAPPQLATELQQIIQKELQQNANGSLIGRAEAAGGFLNFFAQFEACAARFLPKLLSQELLSAKLCDADACEHVVVEYSQPNTHKALHVGHLRGLILGDAVCKILSAAGHTVVKVTYPGDLGAHIAKTLWYLKRHYKGILPETHRGDWLGDLYAEAHAHVEAANDNPELVSKNKAEVGAVLAELQNKQGEYYELWKETREWSFSEMRQVYEWMNVAFDEWYTESECDEPSRQLVLEKFNEGLFVQDQGAIGIDLSAYKLGFALLLKSDGNGLYLTKDLELIRRKFSDPRVTKSIVVVDARQKLHFRQVFKIAELMGFPQAARSLHLDYETVNDASGSKAFSSRTKNGMKLHSLRTLMEEKVTADFLERYRGTWTDEEIQATAKKVTIGAIKYGMLKVDNNTQVNFDIGEWLRLDGDTGPYLQYVHARCLNILAKQNHHSSSFEERDGHSNLEIQAPPAYEFSQGIEQEMLMLFMRYFDAVKQAAELSRPAIVCAYLYELAKQFNRFYEQCSIKDSAGNSRLTRLAIVQSTAILMKNGLGLLGIEAPNRM